MKNREYFALVYQDQLAACAREGLYAWPAENAPVVASKMMAALDAGTFNHDGPAFKRTCKHFGISHTRRAILAYIKADTTCPPLPAGHPGRIDSPKLVEPDWMMD